MPTMPGRLLATLLLLLKAAFLVYSSHGSAQEAPKVGTPPVPSTETNRVYVVSAISIEYGPPGIASHPDLPRVEELLKVRVKLGRTGDIYVRPTRTGSTVVLGIGEIQKPTRFSGEAIIAINQALADQLNGRGFYAIWAAPDSREIDPRTGQDLRQGRWDLHLVVHAAEIQELRTMAMGRRVPPLASTNHLIYRRITENSPLQPPSEGVRGSLLNKSRLDDYVGRLNRFPGRNVTAALSPANQPGGLSLEYIISEDRPWIVYTQASTTGTRASGEWRERFGFIHQQLTKRDDVLSVDYVTAGFEHSHALLGSYEIPILYPDRLKAKLYGSNGEYTADELGLNQLNLSGSSRSAGGDFTFSPLSFPVPPLGGLSLAPAFLDLTIGTKWQNVRLNNRLFGIEAGTDLLLPYAGATVSSISPKSKFTAALQFEGNLSGIVGTDRADLVNLGRLDTDTDWLVMKWETGLSFFLEGILDPHPDKLVHELAISARGQYVFEDRRLIPQQTDLIGGSSSVRGYPEAFDQADTVFVGSAEYRFYLARALKPAVEEHRLLGAKTTDSTHFDNRFRFRARDAYSRPDWDLILRAFVDGGQTHNNRRRLAETDRSLLSTGIGLELQLRRNLNVRADYGFVLRSERENLIHPVEYGDSRLHLSATLTW